MFNLFPSITAQVACSVRIKGGKIFNCTLFCTILIMAARKDKDKDAIDLAIDAAKFSTQSFGSNSLEAVILAIHLGHLYTGMPRTLTTALVYLGPYPFFRSFQPSLSSDILYILTT